ncbi:MAG: diaminopimelate epimerase [Actinomycetota bacterium]
MISPGLEFVKAEALRNDFVIIDGLYGKIEIKGDDAVRLCDRRAGIGADGVLLLEKADGADFAMIVLNADGSEAEMCGNGIRCAAKYVYDTGFARRQKMRVMTGAGLMTVEIREADGDKAVLMRVDLGSPEFKMIEESLPVGYDELIVTALDIGNPHAVVFVDDVKETPVVTIGRLIECHKAFPDRTNVEFVEVTGPGSLNMRVWERGAGETSACGTGAAASLAAAAKTGRTEKQATVALEGGNLLVEWAEDGKLYIEGGANLVYRGKMGGI